MFALMTAAPVVRFGSVLTASLLAWSDLILIAGGLLLLVLARFVVYRRRRGDYESPIPLIDMPTPAAPGQPPRALWQQETIEQHVAERAVHSPSSVADYSERGEEVRAGLVRFHRPPEGTLQLLPGRLEIVSGKEGVDEIRFVKVPGKEPLVTFGRSSGEPHTHIELQSPTVSRKHAAMRFHKGSWHIANLSKTNPVVVRGKQLAVQDAPVRLEDGDEVEMGEVTFRFHAR